MLHHCNYENVRQLRNDCGIEKNKKEKGYILISIDVNGIFFFLLFLFKATVNHQIIQVLL